MKLQLEKYIILAIKISLTAVLFLPLLADGSFYFPFIFSRDVAFRILSELAFVLYLYLALSNTGYRPRFNLLAKVVTAFFVVLLLASIFGVNFKASLWGDYERMGGLFHLAHVYLYFLVLINIFKTKEDWLKAITISLFVSLMTCFIALAQYLDTGVISKAGSGERLSSSIGNASFFAGYLLINLLLGFYLFWNKQFKIKIFFYTLLCFDVFLIGYETYSRLTIGRGFLLPMLSNKIFLAAVIFIQLMAVLAYFYKNKYQATRLFLGVILLFESFILFSTQTRGAVLGVYIGLIILAILNLFFNRSYEQKIKKRLSLWLSLIVLFLLIASPLIIYFNRDASFIQNQPTLRRLATISATDITTQSRLVTWRGSFRGLMDRPVLGWGVENYKDAFNKYFPTEIYLDRGSQLWFDRAHNVVVDVAVSSGFVGLAVYLSIYLVAFWQIFKVYRQKHDFSILIMAVLVVAYFIQDLFVFDTLNTELMIFLVWGFIVFSSQMPPDDQIVKNKISDNKKYSLVPLVFLLVIFVIFTYLFNIKSAQANLLLAKQLALRSQAAAPYYDPRVEVIIMDSINLSPIGRFEARQQLANYLMSLAKSDTNPQQLADLAELTIGELKKSIDEEPQNVRNYLYLATVYNSIYSLNSQYPKDAVKLLTDSIPLSPTRPQIYSERCLAYLNQKLYDEAIADCQKSLDLSPGVMESHWNLFSAYISADRNEEADKELAIAREIGDKIGNPVILDKLMNVYIQFSKWPKLIDLLKQEIIKNPNDVGWHVKLAVAYKENGQKDQARLEAQKALELDPSLKEEVDMFLKLLNE
ncbi:MAG: O-antigen ligase family protein [Candidatus Buchananbacteria bacterium]|nr:O-antigen ligase family protein [Candidatus Buchananbacteria bacterium]